MGRLLAILAVAATALGCGGSEAETSESSGGVDAGIDAAARDTAPEPSDAETSAVIVIVSSADAGSFLGEFYASSTEQYLGGCVPTTFGDCAVLCSASRGVLVSDGTIVVRDGELAPLQILQNTDPDAGDGVVGTYQASMALTSGDVLNIQSSGATAPAFAGLDVRLPQSVPLLAPPLAPGGIYEIATDQDLQVQWTPGVRGTQFRFELFARGLVGGDAAASSPGVGLSCRFDAAAGHGVVPQAALSPYTGASAGLIAGVYVSQTFAVTSSYAIEVAAETTSIDGAWVELH
jgi:hypothetical protein